LVLLSSVTFYATAAQAVDGTWVGTTTDWTDPANWSSNPTVPNGTATFSNTGSTIVDNDNGLVSIGTVQFAAAPNAQAYTIYVYNPFIVTGTGIFNNSTNLQTFNVSTSGGTGNSGTLIFQNNSTASGGSGAVTINNDSGSFIYFQNTSTAGTATIVNNSILQFNDTSTAGAAHITNNVEADFFDSSSAGAANITNSASGITTFNNTATAGTSTIDNSNTLNFNGSSTAGSSAITNESGGITTFSSSGTAGTATVTTNNGGFVFFNGTSTGGQAAFITNAGGTFDMSGLTSTGMTAGSIDGLGSYVLGSKALTVGGNNTSTNVGGAISGTGGSLTKVGSGTLILSGTNTYSGATNVNGGTLEVDGTTSASSLTTVNNGGTLTGIGIIGNTTVASGGIFTPGNGTPGTAMGVLGNLAFASGANYTINLNPTTSTTTSVSGTAALAGTVNAIWAAVGGYVLKQYTILTAGSISGTFGTLTNTNLPAGFGDTLSYDGTHVYLNLGLFTPPASSGLNTNQMNVANAIVNSFNVNGGIPAVFGGLTAGQLTQLSGEVGASFAPVAFQAGNAFLNLMLNPSPLDGNFGTGDYSPIGYADAKRTPATTAFASVDRKQAPIDNRYGFWGSAYGGSGTITGNATTGSHYSADQFYGFAAGLDYRATPDTVFGFALAGGGTNWNLDQGLGSGRSDMFQAGLYGKTRSGAGYVSGALAYSFHDVTTNRTVTIAGTDMLQAKFNANMFSARLESGYRYAMPWAGVTPYAAVQAQSLVLPSYGETAISGSNQFALSYMAHTVNTVRTELGVRLDKTYLLDHGTILTFYSRAAWAHDFGNTANAGVNFTGVPTTNFFVDGATPAADGALLTAGAQYKLINGWSVLAKFDGEFSKTTALYSGSGTVRKVW
jgi:outer membrane autotransporter protein